MRPCLPLALRPPSLFGCARCSLTPPSADAPQVDLDVITAACAHLAARAGAVIRAVHERRVAGVPLRVSYKDAADTRSALTEADAAAQAAIVPFLRSHFPHIAVIGEEDEPGATPFGQPSGHPVVHQSDSDPLPPPPAHALLGCAPAADVAVIVDPLDGTFEFVRGNLSAVQTLAGVVVRGRPLAGIVSLPFADGAPVIVATPAGARGLDQAPAGPKRVGDGVRLVASAWATGAEARVAAIVAAPHALALSGAGNKMLHVARGDADVAVLGLGTAVWDTAATAALVASVGGTVTDFFGAPLSHAGRKGPCGVVATGPHFQERDAAGRSHADLCRAIRARMAADSLLRHVGFARAKAPQASDVARDLDGALITAAFLRFALAAPVLSFFAPESSAVRGPLAAGVRLELVHAPSVAQAAPPPASVFLKRARLDDCEDMWYTGACSPSELAKAAEKHAIEAGFLMSRAAHRLAAAGVRFSRALHVDARPAAPNAPPGHGRFLLLLEDFPPADGWGRFGLLDAGQVRACLAALAELHAFFWAFGDDPDAPDLATAVRPQASPFAPDVRVSSDIDVLPARWKAQHSRLTSSLATSASDGDRSVSLNELGNALHRHVTASSYRLHGVGKDRASAVRTICHGDPRAANFFMRPLQDGRWESGMIDFGWAGWGHPALDVAHLLATSVSPGVLDVGGAAELDFLSFYRQRLAEGLVQFGKAADLGAAEQLLPMDELCKFYDDAIVDLAANVVAGDWHRLEMSEAVLRSRRNMFRSAAYNKDVSCAVWLIERTQALLSELESASYVTSEIDGPH